MREHPILFNTDCFDVFPELGSGTAGVACQQTERRFIGIEKDAEIYRTACQRMGIVQESAA